MDFQWGLSKQPVNLSLTFVFASSILSLLEQAQQSVGVHSSGSQLSVSTIHLNSTLQHV